MTKLGTLTKLRALPYLDSSLGKAIEEVHVTYMSSIELLSMKIIVAQGLAGWADRTILTQYPIVIAYCLSCAKGIHLQIQVIVRMSWMN